MEEKDQGGGAPLGESPLRAPRIQFIKVTSVASFRNKGGGSKMSDKQNVWKTKCPKNKMSEKQNVRKKQNVWKTKCPKNKMSEKQIARITNCPKGKMFEI
jgi:hypothetical protein